MKHAVFGALALAAAGWCGLAQAQAPVQVIAYTSRPVNLRAGPSRDYPVVAVLPAGWQVAVQGCLSTYSWCDVIAGYERGWVYAGNIAYPYGNQWQPLITFGPAIGITVLPFAFDDYWHRYYWNQPWYADRDRWAHLPPRHHIRPRPVPVPPPQGWPDHRDGRRPPAGAPAQVPPAGRPAPVPPREPPRPPGWHPQPRMGPVPSQVVPAAPQPQRQAQPAHPVPRGGERRQEQR